MFYGLHTTTKAERDLALETPAQWVSLDPAWLHRFNDNKPIVIEEGSQRMYDHTDSVAEFNQILEMLRIGQNYNYEDTAYFKRWKHKATEIHTRLSRLPQLFHSIRMEGVKEPVHVEATGERLDGSYRSKIASFLGHKDIPAFIHRFHWSTVTEEFLQRKLRARWESGGKEYYQFQFPNGWWNVPEGGDIYRENAERADFIVPLIEGNAVLDIGCNEGYISIKAALAGKSVQGIDIDYSSGANLNKLIFEFLLKKDLSVTFDSAKVPVPVIDPDTVLFLNVLYHLKKPVEKLRDFKGKQVVIQCNLRKEKERHAYFGSHPDDARQLVEEAGMRVVKEIPWRDKPILIAT